MKKFLNFFKPKLVAYYTYNYKFESPMLEIEENQTIPGYFKNKDRKSQSFWYIDMRDVYAVVAQQNNEDGMSVSLLSNKTTYIFRLGHVQDLQSVYNDMKLYWNKTKFTITLDETEIN